MFQSIPVRTLQFLIPASFLITSALFLGLLGATPVQAQSSHSLRVASERYRDAALGFEHHVLRDRNFDHYDRRLADRLADVSGEFRSATFNPGDVSRLKFHWNELKTTHFRVESELIEACGHPDPALLACWEPVVVAFVGLVEELRCYPAMHGHVGHAHPVYEHAERGEFSGVFSSQVPLDAYQSRRPPVSGIPLGSSRPSNPVYPVVPFRPSNSAVSPLPPSGGAHAFPRSSYPRGLESSHPAIYPNGLGTSPDPRRDIGVAIAATLLNRLLNK